MVENFIFEIIFLLKKLEELEKLEERWSAELKNTSAAQRMKTQGIT